MDKYFYFWGGPLSNFAPINGDESLTSEKFYMARKALFFKDSNTLSKILRATTPREAKKLGREVKNFDQESWDMVKYQVMLECLEIKAELDKSFVSALLDTKYLLLVEASPKDRIWGIGYDETTAPDNIDNWGENLLGKALTELRNKLRENV
jgi:ribA/ribD-fused uncharacterized protein